MNRYALFLGCTLPVRALSYELSARTVAAKLEIELVDLPFTCCGFPAESMNRESSMLMSLRNLALAESRHLDIVGLCSACVGTLTRFSRFGQKEARTEMLESLEGLGIKYGGSTRVRHFARMLYEDLGVERLEQAMSRSLKGLRVLMHCGCHYSRPSESYGGFDDPEHPHTLDALAEATGAESIDVSRKSSCCGAALLAIEKGAALSMTEMKLQLAREVEADALVVVCPFCGIAYDRGQLEIAAQFNRQYGIPVLYLPQLLGLAMGFSPRELGMTLNAINVQKVLNKISG